MSRLSPIETIEELRQHLFDLSGDIAVEIDEGIAITATTVLELYRSPWRGSVALVVHHDAERSDLQYFRRRCDIATGRTAQFPVSASVSIVAARFSPPSSPSRTNSRRSGARARWRRRIRRLSPQA